TCGRPVTLEVSDVFGAADLVVATCPKCADSIIAEVGGAVLDVGRPPGALFALGKGHVTGGAVDALERAGGHAAPFLLRHRRGDFSTLCPEDAQANRDALKHGGRVLSSYRTAAGEKLWVLTDLTGGTTTVLTPDEY